MLVSTVKRYLRDPVKNLFWSFKHSGKILDNLKARDFNATSLSTYDFSSLYTTLHHNLIKDKLIYLIESIFNREGSSYLAYNDRNAFLYYGKALKISCMVLSKLCDVVIFLLDKFLFDLAPSCIDK